MLKNSNTFLHTNGTKSSLSALPGIKLPKADVSGIKSAGRSAKEKISSIVSKKYGELDTKHIFDGIADRDIEKNIPVAETTIQTNVDRGFLDKNKLAKLPNLRDGLALSYAAADVGNKKATNMAKEAAYMEEEPLIKDTGIRWLSNDMPKLSSPFNINASKTADSKNESYAYKPKEEKTSGGDKPLGDVSSVQKEKNNKNGVNVFKAPPPKHSIEEHKQQQGNIGKNHVLQPSDIKSVEEIKEKNKNFSYSADDGTTITPSDDVIEFLEDYYSEQYNVGKTTADIVINEAQLTAIHKYLTDGIKNMERPANISVGTWNKQMQTDLRWVDDMFGQSSNFAKALKTLPAITIGIDTALGVNENIKNKSGMGETVSDAVIDIGFGTGGAVLSGVAGAAIGGVPGVIVGILVGLAYAYYTDNKKYDKYDEKTFKQYLDSLI